MNLTDDELALLDSWSQAIHPSVRSAQDTRLIRRIQTEREIRSRRVTSFNEARASREDDNTLTTLPEYFRGLAEDVEKGVVKGDKAIAVVLDTKPEDGGHGYDPAIRMCNMHMSEGIAAMRAAELCIFIQMGFIKT